MGAHDAAYSSVQYGVGQLNTGRSGNGNVLDFEVDLTCWISEFMKSDVHEQVNKTRTHTHTHII